MALRESPFHVATPPRTDAQEARDEACLREVESLIDVGLLRERVRSFLQRAVAADMRQALGGNGLIQELLESMPLEDSGAAERLKQEVETHLANASEGLSPSEAVVDDEVSFARRELARYWTDLVLAGVARSGEHGMVRLDAQLMPLVPEEDSARMTGWSEEVRARRDSLLAALAIDAKALEELSRAFMHAVERKRKLSLPDDVEVTESPEGFTARRARRRAYDGKRPELDPTRLGAARPPAAHSDLE